MSDSRTQKLVDHLKGPIGSFLFHLLIVLLAVWLIKPVEKAPEKEPLSFTYSPDPAPKVFTPPPVLPDLPPPSVEVDDPIAHLTAYTLPDDPIALDPEMGLDVDDSDRLFERNDDVLGVLVIPEPIKGRSLADRIERAVDSAKGWAGPSEAAVQKALQWLKENQEADGSWAKDRAAMTGLAVLTFLAHDERPGKEPYGDTVEKGLRYLLDHQQADGTWGREYSHAIATYAVSEAYGVTRIPELKPAMERGVARILRGQQASGGWDYKYASGPRRDTSVTGWHIQALKAARLSGSENPGIADALNQAGQDLLSVYDVQKGGFSYSQPGAPSLSMTGVGTVCLQLMGQGATPMVRRSLRFLREVDCTWDGANVHSPLYTWYYVTQARFHQGGMAWDRWNRDFARALIEHQESDGRWEYPINEAGKAEHGSSQGPVYSTTLSALMLQVYHRILNTYAEPQPQQDEGVAEDEILIEII